MPSTYDLEHAQESLRSYNQDELVEIAVTLSEFATTSLLWRAMEQCNNKGMVERLRGRVAELKDSLESEAKR